MDSDAALRRLNRATAISLRCSITSKAKTEYKSSQTGSHGDAKHRPETVQSLPTGPHADPLALPHHESSIVLHFTLLHFAGTYLPSFTVRMMRERSSRP